MGWTGHVAGQSRFPDGDGLMGNLQRTAPAAGRRPKEMTPLNANSLRVAAKPPSVLDQSPAVRSRGPVTTLGQWWQLLPVALLVIAGPALLGSSPYLNTVTLAGIWGIALVGVSMLASLGGQFTFGHAAMVSIGAYATSIVTVEHGGSAMLGVGAGAVLAAVVALATAPILRLRGWYLALATLAMGCLAQELAVNLKSLTGGNDGVIGVPPLDVLGFRVQETATFFMLSWSLVAVLMLGARNLELSRFGSAARAIQVDEDAARSLAIPALRYKVVVWVLAAVMGSLSGSMYAHYSRFVSPQDFGFHQSIVLFMAVLLGGYRSTLGALVALTFLFSVPELGRGLAPTALITALALMVVYALSPDGLAGLAAGAVKSCRGLVRRATKGARHA
jgi:branched-chain amino acid transport system permease protein